MSSREKGELVEVWLVEPGQLRTPFVFKEEALEYLPPDGPPLQVGDLILLPRNVTGDSEEQAFTYGGTLAPFRVLEREHLYFRDEKERFDPLKPRPARYVRTLISVRRLTEDEFYVERGWRPEYEG